VKKITNQKCPNGPIRKNLSPGSFYRCAWSPVPNALIRFKNLKLARIDSRMLFGAVGGKGKPHEGNDDGKNAGNKKRKIAIPSVAC